MLCYARMRISLFIALFLTVSPLAAQLVIDQTESFDASSVYKLPGVQPAQPTDEPEEPEAVVYSGDPIVVAASCEADVLLEAALSCTPASPCRMDLELLLARELGERLLVAGAVRTAAGSVESIVLVSSDGGGSWTEPAERVPAAVVETAEFVDKKVGWVGGQRGVDGAVTQPFLLFTDDAGEEFDLRPIRAGGEAREGYIEQLLFDSADHGYVILEKPNAPVDAFALYETYNGGRSWSIRQIVADRPAIPGARRRSRTLLEPDVRLNPGDGMIELERRSGADWALLARFQVDLGVCPQP